MSTENYLSKKVPTNEEVLEKAVQMFLEGSAPLQKTEDELTSVPDEVSLVKILSRALDIVTTLQTQGLPASSIEQAVVIFLREALPNLKSE